VYWFRRPPYLRWAVAGLVIAAAFAVELRPRPRVQHPFAALGMPAGSVVLEERLEWRSIPAGLLPTPPIRDGMSLTIDIAAGEPLLPGHVAPAAPPPIGWWGIPVALPDGVVAGDPVRLVVLDPPLTVEGRVLTVPEADPLGLEPPGVVVVPGDAADAVARAAAKQAVAVLVAPRP
jgi:hypothetical protein